MSGSRRVPRSTEIPEGSLARGHELRDAGTRWLAGSLIAVGVLMVVAALSMALLAGLLERREAARRPPRAALADDVPAGGPPLEIVPGELLQRLRAAEEELLHGYAWLDREAGTVRIPIERAMELIAERGLPVAETPVAEQGR